MSLQEDGSVSTVNKQLGKSYGAINAPNGRTSSEWAHNPSLQNDEEVSGECDPLITAKYEDSKSTSRWSFHQKISLVTICYGTFNIGCAYSLISPFFPQEAAAKGATPTDIAMIFAAYQLVMFLVSPIYGNLVVYLRPKSMCIIGTFLCGGTNLLFGSLSFTEGIPFIVLCFLVRCVEANGAAMINVAGITSLITLFPGETGRVTSYFEMMSGLGFMLGPLIGAGLYTAGGYYAPFIFVGCQFWLCSLVLLLTLPALDATESHAKNFLKLLSIPGVAVLALYCCCVSLAVTFLDPTMSNWLIASFGVSVTTVGLMFAAWSGTYTLFAPVIGWVVNKGFVYTPMLVSCFGLFIFYMLMGPSPLLNFVFNGKKYFWLIILVCVCLGASMSGMYIPAYSAIINLTEANGMPQNLHTYGMVSGLVSASFSLGAFCGPTLSGFMNTRFGFEWSTTACAFIILSVGIILACFLITMKILRRPVVLPKMNSPDANSRHSENGVAMPS